MVEAQLDAGSADRVPDLLARLQNATDSGQLMVGCLPLPRATLMPSPAAACLTSSVQTKHMMLKLVITHLQGAMQAQGLRVTAVALQGRRGGRALRGPERRGRADQRDRRA